MASSYPDHSYGAVRDTHDPRDKKLHYHPQHIPALGRHDLSEYVDKVYDQRRLESCTANAICAAYCIDLKMEEEEASYDSDDSEVEEFEPSRLFLYYNSRSRSEKKKNVGTSIRDAIKAFKKYGVCSEEDWQYYTTKFKEKPPPRCYRRAKHHKIIKYHRLHQDIDQLRACIKDSCPFVFGMDVFDSFESKQVSDRGTMKMPTKRDLKDDVVGSHAILAVGYNDTKQKFKCLNSWGSHWGDNGYFYMPYAFIENEDYCFDFWKITFVI